MNRAGHTWTTRELFTAQRMRREGFSYRRIGAALNRSMQAVQVKLNKDDRPVASDRIVHIVVPLDALSDRVRRYLTPPRNLTAALMGDPLPGYSALDKR